MPMNVRMVLPLYSLSSAVLTSRLRNVSRCTLLASSDCWRWEARNAWLSFISRCWINSTSPGSPPPHLDQFHPPETPGSPGAPWITSTSPETPGSIPPASEAQPAGVVYRPRVSWKRPAAQNASPGLAVYSINRSTPSSVLASNLPQSKLVSIQ